MSSTPNSATPSRKRSKWDTADEEEAGTPYTPPQPAKRRTKTRTATPESDHRTSPIPSTSSSRPPAAQHSVYAPPRTLHPSITPSRSVYSYERLNQIEEGSYGIVYRARERESGEIVALKKLKLEEEKYGFPITALREINSLMLCRHENVVRIREVVVGETLTQ